jgi:hypothetical protein
MQIMGDLMFKNMDFAGSQAMAERMKKVIDPKFLDENNEDPAVMALQGQLQEAQTIMQAMQAEIQKRDEALNSKQQDLEIKAMGDKLKMQSEQAKNELEVMKLQLQQQENMEEGEIKKIELSIKQKELEIKESELMLKKEEMYINMQMQAQAAEQSKMQAAQTEPQPQQPQNDAMAMAMAGIAQALNNTTAPKKIIRNKQGLIDQIVLSIQNGDTLLLGFNYSLYIKTKLPETLCLKNTKILISVILFSFRLHIWGVCNYLLTESMIIQLVFGTDNLRF